MSLATYLARRSRRRSTTTSPTWHGELRSRRPRQPAHGRGVEPRRRARSAAARAERALERLAEPASRAVPPGRRVARPRCSTRRGSASSATPPTTRSAPAPTTRSSTPCSHRYAEARQIGEGLADRAVDGARRVGRRRRARRRQPVGPHARRARRAARSPATRCRRARRCSAPAPAEADARRVRRPSAWPPASSPSSSTCRRYTAARIVDGDGGEVVFAHRPRRRRPAVSPDDRAELERLMADATATRPLPRRRSPRQPGRKVLARVEDVPGYGWAAWTRRPRRRRRRRRRSTADDGTSLTQRPRHRRRRRFRLVDGGDVGDTYNWCPPDDDAARRARRSLDADVVETGPLRGRLRLRPRGGRRPCDVDDRRRAARRRAPRPGRDDDRQPPPRPPPPRPPPAAARRRDRSEAECAFAVVERGPRRRGRPDRAGPADVPVAPLRRAPAASPSCTRALLEYELVGIGDDGSRTELAVTLLRCTGHARRRARWRTRPLPAGPFQPLEGPQLQRRLTLGGASPSATTSTPTPLVDDAFLPLRAVAGGGRAGDRRPADAGSALTVDGRRGVGRAPHAGRPARGAAVQPDAPTPTTRRAARPPRLGRRPPRPPGRALGGRASTSRPWQIATLVLLTTEPG